MMHDLIDGFQFFFLEQQYCDCNIEFAVGWRLFTLRWIVCDVYDKLHLRRIACDKLELGYIDLISR